MPVFIIKFDVGQASHTTLAYYVEIKYYLTVSVLNFQASKNKSGTNTGTIHLPKR